MVQPGRSADIVAKAHSHGGLGMKAWHMFVTATWGIYNTEGKQKNRRIKTTQKDPERMQNDGGFYPTAGTGQASRSCLTNGQRENLPTN